MALSSPILLKLKNISARNKLRYGVGVLVLLIAVGGFIYATKTGKITPFAATGGGTITGKVYDRNGKAIAGAKITANAPFTLSGQTYSVTSSSTGSYSISGLKQDTALYFEKDGSWFSARNFGDVTTVTIPGQSLSITTKFIAALQNATNSPSKFQSRSRLKNGSFDDWSSTLPNLWAPGNATVTKEENTVKDGLYSAKIAYTGTGRGALTQLIQNLPAGTYQASGWVKITSGQGAVDVTYGNYQPLCRATSGTTDWKQISCNFNLNAPQTVTVQVGGILSPVNGFFDNIKVIPTISIACSAGKFCPTANATREQIGVLVAYLSDLDTTVYNPNNSATWAHTFSDVATSSPSWPYVQALYASGIMRGTTDTTFKPTDPLTRAQLATILFRALHLEPYDAIDPDFTDVPKDFPVYKEIESIYLVGITSGCTNTTFCPNNPVTREQLAIFLGRAFNNIEITSGGFNPRKVTFSVADGQTGNYDIYLSPTGKVGKVAGKAVLATGAAVANATVVVSLEPSISENYSTVTGFDGSFLIPNVPEGSYGYYILKSDSADTYQLNNWENAVFVDADQTANIDASGLQ